MEGESYDAAFFERALAKAYACRELKVETFHREMVIPSGTHFCSVIHKVILQFRRSPGKSLESGNYIIKDLLSIAADLGSSEKFMFEEVLPAMAKILEKAPPKLGDRKLSADCLLADVSAGKEIYILEDLGALGFGPLNRVVGLTFDDAKVCLRKIALFHGASMVLGQEQPGLVAKLSPSHYINGITDPTTKAVTMDATEIAADLFAEELPEIARKMKAQIPETYSNRMQKVVDPERSGLKVIVHGDSWLNNILFDRENQRAVLLDYQNSFWGSPAIDLHFFCYTSLQKDVLLHRQEDLLEFYLNSLLETLILCGFKGSLPTMKELKDEIHHCLYYAYFAAVCELPICCAPPEVIDGFDVTTFADRDKMVIKRSLMFSNKRVRETVKACLLHFDQEGILETP
ncbi:hypothetical protein KR009_002390 [Drosophila setifemur]|nr:hypothetical protein KR009_002390 [Drosophila setifemur]